MNERLKYIWLVLITLSIFNLKAQESIDSLVVTYMSSNKIPGISLAIVENDNAKTNRIHTISDLKGFRLLDFICISLPRQVKNPFQFVGMWGCRPKHPFLCALGPLGPTL